MVVGVHVLTGGILVLAALGLGGCIEADPGDGDGSTSWSNGASGVGVGDSDGGGGGGGTSGGGGGSGGTLPEDPMVSNAFYPFVNGARWTYSHSGEGTVWDENVALDRAMYEGRAAMLLADTPGPSGTQTRSYLVQDGTEVRRIHKEVLFNGNNDSVVDYDPGFTRFDEAWAALAINTTMTLSYMRTEMLFNGTVTVETRVQQYTLESTDAEITVPAGTFSGCVVIFRARQASSGGPPIGADIREKRYWFCPGVGKVREENLTDGGIEVLKWCSVPGGNC